MLSNCLLEENPFFNMLIKKSIGSSIKKIFKQNAEFTTTCKICDMKFGDPERTKRHMMRAHSKPKKEKQV